MTPLVAVAGRSVPPTGTGKTCLESRRGKELEPTRLSGRGIVVTPLKLSETKTEPVRHRAPVDYAGGFCF